MEKISQSQFVGKVNEEISQIYQIEKAMGEGAFSVVYLAKHIQSGIKRCIKKISKRNFTRAENENIMNEIKILKEIDHPNIIKIIEYYESKRSLYIVTEYLDGGELFDKISEKKAFSEKEACEIITQILRAIIYLHSHNVIHRDLKPENIIFEKLGENHLNLKIIDFGTSRKVFLNEKLTTKMGTPYYIAPEVLKRNYDQKCDVWSLGVILYILYCGYPPFNGSTDKKIMQRIQTDDFTFPHEDWKNVSQEAKELIQLMLQKNPDKRPTAAEVFKHSWFHNAHKIDKNLYQKNVFENLLKFRTQYHFQTLLRLYMINYMDFKQEKKQILEAFKELDKNGDGQISKEELKDFLKESQILLKQEEIDQIIKKLDINESNNIDYSEFLLGMFDYKKNMSQEKIEQMFKLIDSNKDGNIQEKELAQFFRLDTVQGDLLRELMKEADSNKDGMISFEEFKNVLLKVQKIRYFEQLKNMIQSLNYRVNFRTCIFQQIQQMSLPFFTTLFKFFDLFLCSHCYITQHIVNGLIVFISRSYLVFYILYKSQKLIEKFILYFFTKFTLLLDLSLNHYLNFRQVLFNKILKFFQLMNSFFTLQLQSLLQLIVSIIEQSNYLIFRFLSLFKFLLYNMQIIFMPREQVIDLSVQIKISIF